MEFEDGDTSDCGLAELGPALFIPGVDQVPGRNMGEAQLSSPPPPPLHLWDNLFLCPVFWILPHLSQIRLILDLTLKHRLPFHFCLGREGKAE